MTGVLWWVAANKVGRMKCQPCRGSCCRQSPKSTHPVQTHTHTVCRQLLGKNLSCSDLKSSKVNPANRSTTKCSTPEWAPSGRKQAAATNCMNHLATQDFLLWEHAYAQRSSEWGDNMCSKKSVSQLRVNTHSANMCVQQLLGPRVKAAMSCNTVQQS